MTRHTVILLAVGLVVSLAACGDTETDAAPTTTAAPTTVVAPATTTGEQPGSDVGPFPEGEPIDLVYLCDSGGQDVGEFYGPMAAAALDREVRVHELVRGRLTEILSKVQGSWADDVAEAEIIVLYANPGGLDDNVPLPKRTCNEAGDALEDPEDYTGDWNPGQEWEEVPALARVEDWQPFREVLDQIYDEIWRLRAGRPTILRAHNIQAGRFVLWREMGIESECIANWEVISQVHREAAEANGAVFVSFFDVFNGPEHDEDPREKGWIADDGFHAKRPEGLKVKAEALAAVGFEVSEPPG